MNDDVEIVYPVAGTDALEFLDEDETSKGRAAREAVDDWAYLANVQKLNRPI